MKVAFITPINYLHYVNKGDMAFALSKFILESPKYRRFFHKNSKYKIVDNMAAELGESIDCSSILEAAKKVKSDEVWASDKLYDSAKTMQFTKQFIVGCSDRDLKRFKIAGVPQGTSLSSWIHCYKEMLKMQEIKVICLSKYSIVPAFSSQVYPEERSIFRCRIAAIKYLLYHGLIDKKREYHCAGGDHLFYEEVLNLKKYKGLIRSIDSNIPFKLGLAYLRVDSKIKEEPIERLNFRLEHLTQTQKTIIEHNIKAINRCKK